MAHWIEDTTLVTLLDGVLAADVLGIANDVWANKAARRVFIDARDALYEIRGGRYTHERRNEYVQLLSKGVAAAIHLDVQGDGDTKWDLAFRRALDQLGLDSRH